MTRIGFFGAQYHSFFLYYMTRVATSCEYDVRVYTTQQIHDRIESLYTDEEYEGCEWVLQEDGESFDAFFDRVERSAERDLDLLWTILAWGKGRTPPNFLEFDPDCPAICGITNLNDWTYNPFPDSVYRAVDRWMPLARRLLRFERANTVFNQSRYLMQPGIIDNYDAVHIEYPPMARFIENEVEWEQEFYEFYPVVFESEKLPAVERTDTRRIAVPGRISQHVRDIDTLLDAMETVFERYDDEVVLDFVGRLYGDYESVLDRIETLQDRGYDVRYREDWIPYEEFAEGLRAADIIINPLHVRRVLKHPLRSDMWTGRTNGTGLIFDALRYARPLVVPELFPVDERLEPFTETYDNVEHLSELLLELLSDDERRRTLQEGVDRAASDLTVEAQKPRFETIVDDLRSR